MTKRNLLSGRNDMRRIPCCFDCGARDDDDDDDDDGDGDGDGNGDGDDGVIKVLRSWCWRRLTMFPVAYTVLVGRIFKGDQFYHPSSYLIASLLSISVIRFSYRE